MELKPSSSGIIDTLYQILKDALLSSQSESEAPVDVSISQGLGGGLAMMQNRDYQGSAKPAGFPGTGLPGAGRGGHPATRAKTVPVRRVPTGVLSIPPTIFA